VCCCLCVLLSVCVIVCVCCCLCVLLFVCVCLRVAVCVCVCVLLFVCNAVCYVVCYVCVAVCCCVAMCLCVAVCVAIAFLLLNLEPPHPTCPHPLLQVDIPMEIMTRIPQACRTKTSERFDELGHLSEMLSQKVCGGIVSV